MSARDDAAEVMHEHVIAERFFEDALEEIPNDVLIRLAVERGALRAVTIGVGSPLGELFVIETGEDYDEREHVIYMETEDS